MYDRKTMDLVDKLIDLTDPGYTDGLEELDEAEAEYRYELRVAAGEQLMLQLADEFGGIPVRAEIKTTDGQT